MTIKGAVVFGTIDQREECLLRVRSMVASANKDRDDLSQWLQQAPVTQDFIPASWGYPDRWFIHWDQFPG